MPISEPVIHTYNDKLDTLRALSNSLERMRNQGVPTELDVVQLLRMIASTAESALPTAVALAVEAGASWTDVGRMLGTSKQAAWAKYAELTADDDEDVPVDQSLYEPLGLVVTCTECSKEAVHWLNGRWARCDDHWDDRIGASGNQNLSL